MDKRKRSALLSLAALVPAALYTAGIAAQFLINYHAWEAAGAHFGVPPGFPSPSFGAAARALTVWPEGPASLAAVAAALGLTVLYGLRHGRGKGGVKDPDRNLTISDSGSCGTAGFMEKKEAKKLLRVTAPEDTDGDILGAVGKDRVISLPAETRLNANLAVCGASGTGKSRSISRNLVLQSVRRGESVILTDPKSELYESMGPYLRDHGYVVKVFNLVDMDHSDSWNCLGEVGGSELMAQTFADVVLSNTSGDRADAFWYSAELNLLKALVLYAALEEPPGRRNFARVYDLLCQEGEYGLSDAMERVRSEHRDPFTGEVLPPSPAYAPYSLFMQASSAVRSSVIIGLGSKLQVLQAKQVRNITSYSGIDLELPGKKKCAYFCIVSDQDSTFNFLSSLFFCFLFIRLIHYADLCCENGMLEPRVRFILDEFPNCVLIPDFTKRCSVIRSRGCSVAVFFQNIGQMKNRYPNEQWQEILGACDSTVFLGCTDLLTAEYFSSRAGIASVELESRAQDVGTEGAGRSAGYRMTQSLGRRQLMTPDEILRLPMDREMIFIRGMKPLLAERFDYSRHPEYPNLRSEKAVLHEPDWKTAAARADAQEKAAAARRADAGRARPEDRRDGAAGPRRRAEPADIDEII